MSKNIFAISGSLRSGSSNHAVLRLIGKMVPAGIRYSIYDKLAKIPPFDPRLDHESPPETVTEFLNFITHADAVIICTPEYAYGVPGQLKNALDWTVSSGSLSTKPVALITASTGGENAYASLLLILGALNSNVNKSATLLIPFIRSKMDADGNIHDTNTLISLKSILNSMLNSFV